MDQNQYHYLVWPLFFLMQCDTSSSHRVDQAVDCDLWNVVPLLFNGCAKMLCGNCQELEHTVVHVYPEHPKHAQWVTSLVRIQAMGELGHSRNCVQIIATWGCAWSCWNMRWWWRMNGTTMSLRISSRYLCAFKLPLIKCNCVSVHSLCLPVTPLQPWGTLFTKSTSANHLPTQRHTRGLRLWGQLDVLPNSLKWHWLLAYGREMNI